MKTKWNKAWKKKVGSNQYKTRYKNWFIKFVLRILVILAIVYLICAWYEKEQAKPIISPVPEVKAVSNARIITEEEAKDILRKSIPNMVERSAEKFTTNDKQKNYITYQLYCLLRKESNFGENEDCGDSGKSCGILQFREATYNRIRKEMIRKGLVTELGDRFSPFYSIETTAYALTQGYGNEWGPVKRGECK